MSQKPLLLAVILTSTLFSSTGLGQEKRGENIVERKIEKKHENNVEGNEIFIYGSKSETRLKRYGGYGQIVEPDQSSRFDVLSHLQKESSLTTLETGRISPTGSSLPRIRGHDAKLTEVYVEDLPLQNPYGGLPLIDHLDLRSFGRMEIYQGVSPYDLPGSSPAGTMRYRWRKEPSRKIRLGLQGGKPYGSSIWGLFLSGQNQIEKTFPETTLSPSKKDGENSVFHRESIEEQKGKIYEFRLYTRQHRSDGKYLHYSDEGTPYNTADDRIAQRTNNDQTSLNLMPMGTFTFGPWKMQGLGWWADSRAGLPTLSARVPSLAREHTSQSVVSFGLSRQWYRGSLKPLQHNPQLISQNEDQSRSLKIDLKVLRSEDHHRTFDPGAGFLVLGESAQLNIKTTSFISSLHSTTPVLDTQVSSQISQTQVAQDYGPTPINRLGRHASVLALGVRIKPFLNEMFLVEGKKSWREERSKNIQALSVLQTYESSVAKNSRKPTSQESLLLSWSPVGPTFESKNMGPMNFYLQAARSERPPTLFEEFGNGSTISPNPNLEPEKITHREAGFKLFYGRFEDSLSLSSFKDSLDDKVIFVPIYANGSRAFNVRKAMIEGFEARAQVTHAFHPLFPTTFYAASSHLRPLDQTRTTVRILPSIPEKIVVLDLTQKTPWFVTKWVARYRSTVFRDANNETSLPGSWIHDFYADTSYDWPDKKALKLGLMIRNILDRVDVPVSTSPTSGFPSGQTGRTALSDVAGAPLPGRQWVAHLTIDLK